MRRRTWIVAGFTLLVVAFGVWFASSTPSVTSTGHIAATTVTLDPDARAPDGERVRVRVLNGAGTAGLARRGMQLFRDYGYDVVDYGNAPARSDSTVVEVDARTGAWSDRIARVLGGTVVVRERAVPLPYVDVTVTLGADWKPPTQPFRP